MKQKVVLYLFLAAIIASGCSSGRKNMEDLPFIDVRKNYPEKELLITDFADVSYVHLNSANADYLYKGFIAHMYVTNNTFVIYDNTSGSILFFSKDGTPKSRFNRVGQGPEEYYNEPWILYDEETDDIFVGNDQVDYIQVYSSRGEYKRRIPLPKYTPAHSLVSFDNQSFMVFTDEYYRYIFPESREKNKDKIPNYITYYRISKTNGEVLDSFILLTNDVFLVAMHPELDIFIKNIYYRSVKGKDGLFVCNPENDTVFLYTHDKSLTPVFHKIPSVHKSDPMVVLDNVVDVSRYQFFYIRTIHWDIKSYPFKYYFRDKETNEIFRQKIILPDYKNKEFYILAGGAKSAYGDGHIYELSLMELKQANKENRLSGKLKELVNTLNEFEDNNVFMLVHFK